MHVSIDISWGKKKKKRESQRQSNCHSDDRCGASRRERRGLSYAAIHVYVCIHIYMYTV